MHDERNLRTITRSSGARLCCRRLTRAAVDANSRRDDDKPADDIGVDHNAPINHPRHITLDHNRHNNHHNDRAHLNGARALGRLRPELRGQG
jgi:hypothetical protein